MLLLSHPTGNTFSRALLQGAMEEGILAKFATTIGFSGGAPKWSRFSRTLSGELGRRSFACDAARLYTRPLREAVRLIANRVGVKSLTRHEHGWASVDAVYRDLDAAVAKHLSAWSRSNCLTAVYAYEDGALQTFQTARQLGLRTVYELPIAYWETSRRLLKEEAERYPEWEPTLGGTDDSTEKLERKTEELHGADLVICPSQFVHDSLPKWARQSRRCVVAEFGSPISDSLPRTVANTTGKLRLLFAGTMSQRKGLADVFAAMQRLSRSDVELVVMGSQVLPMEFYRRQYPDFRYEPPRPHSAVLELMRSCHALILPSIVEGRALVQQEAMSAGLPLLVTANAGGADLVQEGRTGFLVPIRSPESLAEKIAWLADHRADLHEMGRCAREKASQLTWRSYAEKILSAVNEMCLAPARQVAISS